MKNTTKQLATISARNQSLVKKWSKVLKKMPEVPKHKLANMAILLENQFKHNNDGKNGHLLVEDAVSTGDIADFTRFALPLIRKSYARLIADEIVGVQPMSQPASLVFYVRYRYGTNKGQTIAGTQIMRQNTAQQFARQNGWAIDPYYSSQMVKDEDLTISSSGQVITGTLQHRPVLAGSVVVNIYDSDDSDCEAPEPIIQVTFDATGTVDGIYNSSPTTYTVDTTGRNTEFDHSTGVVKVTLSSGSVAGKIARVDYEYDLENNPFQPEIKLSIDSDTVQASTRKLKTSWSLEAAQDMKAVHNLDAESMLIDLLADEMVAEIDREILNSLIISAAIRSNHNFSTAAGASVNFTDRNIALLYKILEVANLIHKYTLMGAANWLVTSPDISSKLEQVNDFRASDVLQEGQYDIGIQNAGTIQGRIKVYKDPLFPQCKVLLGFKGDTAQKTGFIYAPYIPLLATPTIMDPTAFTPTAGLMSRYGLKLLEDGSLFYGTISVSSL